MNHLIIRADSTAKIGTGHIMRCLALAQAWQDQDGKVTFISHCESDALRQRLIEEGMNFINIEKSHPDPGDLEYTMRILDDISNQRQGKTAWLVIDGYHFDATYQKRIKDTGYKILWIDDYGHADHYYADLVLNQNISANASLYAHCEPYTQLLLGTRYTLLRREFKQWQGWQREIPTVARKVLVTMGGSDPYNVTKKVTKALKQVNISGLEAKIVVGPANPNLQSLAQEIGDNSNLQIITNATNIPELMAWADVAVSAGGSTCWEIALMGLPNLLIILAGNQANVATGLRDHGLSINIGWYNNINTIDIAKALNDLMKSDVDRKKMLSAGKSYVDGKGSARIMSTICCEDLLLRKASIEDCEVLFKWVNDPDARQSAFRSEPITFDEHAKWYRENLDNNNFIQFIAVDQDKRAIGQVRFDLKNDEADVDVSVAKEFRSLGYGACLVKKGVDAVVNTFKIGIFSAYIKPYNQASIRSFERAGFSILRRQVIDGHEAVNMVYHKRQG